MNIRLSTKEAIVEAAFQLFKDNPRASLADIAKLAGVGRVTLHRYFPGRDDLVIDLARLAIRELDEVAEQATENATNYTDAMRLMLFALVPLADRHWFLSNQIIDGHPEILKEKQRQIDEMIEVIDQAKKEGGFDPSVSSAWISEAFDGLLISAWEMVRKDEATARQAAELAWQTLTNGLGNDNG